MSPVQVETRERTELRFTMPTAAPASPVGATVVSAPGSAPGSVAASASAGSAASGSARVAASASAPAAAASRRIAVMGIYPNADPDLPGRVEGFFLTLGWLIFERVIALLLFVKKGELH